MKKIGLLFILVLLLAGSFFVAPKAEEEYYATMLNWDHFVFAGGVFDAYVVTNLPNPTYQWHGRLDQHVADLEDNARYGGTHSNHFTFLTSDSYAYGTDWEQLRFYCTVTGSNGISIDTNETFMDIGSTAMLERVLANNPQEITGFYVRGASDTTATEYTVEAGKAMYLSVNTSTNPNMADFNASEITIKKEILVTENGTSRYLGVGDPYVPRKIGTAAVTARVNYVMYINDVFYKILDQKSITIHTKMPDTVGYARAKQDGSLLAEMYNESQKVGSFTKGQWVNLLEQNGSWWKIAVNSTVGYVPVTAIYVPEAVEYVSVDIAEPVAGKVPATTANMESDAYTVYPATGIEWYDLTASRYLNAGESFQNGHSYRLILWLKIAGGGRFAVLNDYPTVTAVVNGKSASVYKAYEQDPEEVIEVRAEYTHLHSLTSVSEVKATCVSDGKKGFYHCSCGADFEDANASVKIENLSEWGIIPATGHQYSEWRSDGSMHYRVCVNLGCGTEDGRGYHTGGTATCTAKASCTVCGLSYGEKLPHTPGPEASEKEPQRCTECGIILAPALDHAHRLVFTEKKDPDCIEEGHEAYYTCEDCGRIFKDENAQAAVEDPDSLILPPLGHLSGDDWHYDEVYHFLICTRCGQTLDETMRVHDEAGEDGKCPTCGYKKGDPIPQGGSETKPAGEEPGSAKEKPGNKTDEAGNTDETKPEGENGTPEKNRDAELPSSLKTLFIVLTAAGAALILAAVAVIIILVKKPKKKKE